MHFACLSIDFDHINTQIWIPHYIKENYSYHSLIKSENKRKLFAVHTFIFGSLCAKQANISKLQMKGKTSGLVFTCKINFNEEFQ